MRFESVAGVEKALVHLGALMEASKAGPVSLLVCGGASLMVLGQVARATHDIDLLACLEVCPTEEAEVEHRSELPEPVRTLAQRVADDLGLDVGWLNLGPSSLVELGLPAGLLKRAERRRYGRLLTALYVSRLDQIHLKLYASLGGGERHIADLFTLKFSGQELQQAARWILAVAGDMVLKTDLEKLLGDLGHECKL
jgi:hypothetical protein